MQYTSEVLIDRPREHVVNLFDDPDALHDWVHGLQSVEPLSGEPGQIGARSRMVFDRDGRTTEMVETIVTRDLPETFVTTYETNGVWNRVTNQFHAPEPGVTRWVALHEFKFSGFMRLIGLLFRGSFPKQTEQDMQRFKQYAERHPAPERAS